MPITAQDLQAKLDLLDDGILRAGSHQPGREFCALEFESQVRGREWSDQPITLPDLRPLNDAYWSSSKVRTLHLLRVMSALWDWAEWSLDRKAAWAKKVVLGTVQTIPDTWACNGVESYESQAFYYSRKVGPYYTVRSINHLVTCAAIATKYAAQAAIYNMARTEDADNVLIKACNLWVDAALEGEE